MILKLQWRMLRQGNWNWLVLRGIWYPHCTTWRLSLRWNWGIYQSKRISLANLKVTVKTLTCHQVIRKIQRAAPRIYRITCHIACLHGSQGLQLSISHLDLENNLVWFAKTWNRTLLLFPTRALARKSLIAEQPARSAGGVQWRR